MPVTVTASNTPPPVKRQSAAEKRVSATTASRTDALNGLGQLVQVPLIITKQHADAGAVGMHWPNIAREVAQLAETQPAIAKIIDPLLQAGPYAGLIAAVLPFAVQIAVNHGRVAPGAMGSVPGTALASQIEANIAKAELEALKVQQQAQQETARIRLEIEQSRQQVLQDAA